MAKHNLGLIHVYTGNGKGKTSASMGLALRAIGQGLKVYIIQFMKGGAYTGELIACKNFLPNATFAQFGKPCIKDEKQMKLLGFEKGYEFYDNVRDDIVCGECRFCFVNDDEQRQFCRDAIARAEKVVTCGDYDLVVLDEVNVAMAYGYVRVEELMDIIGRKFPNTELILTGRNAPQQIIEVADYVTIMQEVKHPFRTRKQLARRGVEY